jgi:predicted transcriptional regulator
MSVPIEIDDDVYATLDELAERTGRATADVIADILRSAVAQRRPGDLPVFQGDGLREGVSLGSMSALLDVMETDVP